MSAAQALIERVEAAGGRLVPRGGDGLHVQAPAPLPDALVAELRQHKGELLGLLTGGDADRLAAVWGHEVAELIHWFRGAEVPTEPFELTSGVTVVRPAHWWLSIAADIEDGPQRARGATGALAGDLKKLHGLFGQAGGEADEGGDIERVAIMEFDGTPSDGSAA